MEKFKILSDVLKKSGIKKEPLELAKENAEIWYKRCQENESKLASVSLELDNIKKRLEEAEYCLNLIDVHTASLGGTKRDMVESLVSIYNICRIYFREEEKDLAAFAIKLVEYKGKVR